MAKITVEGFGVIEAPVGTKLVLALEDAGIDILHRCGGRGLCTSCRVEALEGETEPISDVEREALEKHEIDDDSRLSCQMRVLGDMTVRVARRASDEGLEPGPRPAD
ncbi:MAG: 2Fe-2S iron-sulfur cluster-binding protein [Armatimonadetes bacterium]|nr:2Fe-2S iron-sulfur cluster-binding protein [Armatimonadota bacterium]